MRLGKFGKLKTWWGRPEGWRLRKRVTFESKGSLLTNQEELVLHIKPRGILLPEFSLALRDISLLFYSGLQLIRWGPSTLWRAIYFIQRLKCKSHPKTPTKKDSESVQFSHSVMSDSLQPHELQHARPPCPSPIPRVHPNPHPSSWWCHPTTSSFVVPFSSCPQSFLASGTFPMSQLFASGGQSIGVSASISILPMNTQDWSPLGWTGWISLQSKGFSRVFSNTTVQKHQFFSAQPYL